MFVHVVGLEDEVELEVYETKVLELLVVGSVEFGDDDTELGEGDTHKVHETFETVAGFWSGERGDVSRSVSRSGRSGRSGRSHGESSRHIRDADTRYKK